MDSPDDFVEKYSDSHLTFICVDKREPQHSIAVRLEVQNNLPKIAGRICFRNYNGDPKNFEKGSLQIVKRFEDIPGPTLESFVRWSHRFDSWLDGTCSFESLTMEEDNVSCYPKEKE